MHLLVLVTHITNGGKVSTMLHKDAGDGSNSQLILKWPRYYMFFNNSQAKIFQSELVASEALITHTTDGSKASMM